MTQLQAMARSIVIEVPVALLLGPRQVRTVAAGIGATLVTHPVLWAAWFPLRARLPYAATALLLEGVVVLVEAAIYRLTLPVSWGRAALISLAANAAAFGIGLLFG